MAQISFEHLFKSGDRDRDKFLSRLFGIFSERIVRVWCEDHRSKYSDLGRPTLKSENERKGCTLDFTFKSRQDGHVFVGELKCELEFQDYHFLKLTSFSDLEHHKSKTFARFLKVARNPGEYMVTVNRKSIQVAGAILVWGSVDGNGRAAVMKENGFKDVLSLEEIIAQLQDWGNEGYRRLLDERAHWCQNLFEQLALGH